MSSSYRFTRQPLWLFGHVIALGAIVLFVNLGFWQLGRNADRLLLDDQVREHLAADPIDLETARTLSSEDLELRRVMVTGSFDVAGELILQARSFRGRSGHNVLTPLVVDGDRAIVVNRGWVPIDISDPPIAGAAPQEGEVEVIGIARKTETRAGLGPVDPATGILTRVSRVDIDRLQQQSKYALEGFYLQLVSPMPPGEFPMILDAPQVGEGPPHLAYAVQWFAFACVVMIGYPLLLRSTAKRGSAS